MALKQLICRAKVRLQNSIKVAPGAALLVDDSAKLFRNEIGIEHVLACLKPHWERRPETARRLRGRIERLLNAAKAAGHREEENPAAWRGHLENLLPARTKLSRGHHPALPFAEIPGFISKLRQ